MAKAWKSIIWGMIVLWVVIIVGMGLVIASHAQVTQGTVFSKTEDGLGNKITSSVVGISRGLDVNVIAGGGGSGTPYLDADAIVNQTTTAIHGQTYLYNGATWDRARGTIANGMLVDVSRVTGNVTVVQGTGTNLHIVCDSGCGGAASFTDNAAFTFGTTAINNMGAVVDDVATNVVTENSAGAPRMNTNRILYSMPTNVTGTALYPTAVVEADGIANPTLTQISTFIHGWNGATWDRLKSTTANGLVVDVSRVQGTVATTPPANASTNVAQFGGNNVVTGTGVGGVGTPRVTVSSDSNVLATQSGTWNIGTVTTLTGITNPVAVTGTFFQATQPVSIAATVTVQGAKTNNNAAPGATNVGVLPCVATAVAPTQTEGNQVGCSTDLAGNERIIGAVSVSNFPVTQPVSIATMPLTQIRSEDGSLVSLGSKSDAPASTLGNASVIALLKALNLELTKLMTGVSVTNFPTTQGVSGTVAVSNFPTSVIVTANGPIGLILPPCNPVRRTQCQSQGHSYSVSGF